MDVNVIRHWPQRGGMPRLTSRPLASPPVNRGLGFKWRVRVIGCRLGGLSQFHDLLFKSIIFRRQFVDSFLEDTGLERRSIAGRPEVVQLPFKVLVLRTETMCLIPPMFVPFQFRTIHGKRKLPRMAKVRARQNPLHGKQFRKCRGTMKRLPFEEIRQAQPSMIERQAIAEQSDVGSLLTLFQQRNGRRELSPLFKDGIPQLPRFMT